MLYLWTALYAGCILLANLALNHFIELPVYGQLSLGTIFFAAVFTLRDKIHGYGLRQVFIAIGMALAVNVVACIALEVPVRFIAASFIAILLSELADTGIFARLQNHSWLTRALASNAVSVPIDTIFFALLAFYGTETNAFIMEVIWADLIAKLIIAALIAIALLPTVKKPQQLAS